MVERPTLHCFHTGQAEHNCTLATGSKHNQEKSHKNKVNSLNSMRTSGQFFSIWNYYLENQKYFGICVCLEILMIKVYMICFI